MLEVKSLSKLQILIAESFCLVYGQTNKSTVLE